jgi:hypothetical protein
MADQGPVFQKALAKALPHLEIEIVKRPDHAKGFEVLPQRLAMPATGQGLRKPHPQCLGMRLASTQLMLRKLCKQESTFRTDSRQIDRDRFWNRCVTLQERTCVFIKIDA